MLSLSDSSTLHPKHVLYRCEVDIGPDVRLGIYPVQMTKTAGTDPLGNAKTITALDGAIRVVTTDATGLNFLPDADWDADDPDAGGGSGSAESAGDACAITPSMNGHASGFVPLGALIAAYAARRRH